MQFRRATRALSLWFAVAAVLIAALVPAISRALGTGTSATWVQVCSSAGSKWVEPGSGAGDTPSVPGSGALLEHCPYCSLHASAMAVGPVSVGLFTPLSLGHEFPVARLAARRPAHAWLTPQPRGPPAFS